MLFIRKFDVFYFLHSAYIRLHLALQGGERKQSQGSYLRTQRQGNLLVDLGAKTENF